MENSTKAILIAAAILIVIILVAISVKILSSPKDIKENAESVSQTIGSMMDHAVGVIKTPFDVERQPGETGSGGTTSEETTLLKSISLDKESISLILGNQDTITATLTNIEGNITWENTNDNIVSIDGKNNTTILLKGKSAGVTTITAKCGDYTASCTITVIDKIEPQVGTYVEYDVSYIDMYNTHKNAAEYTKTTGWRYLGEDGEGNKLIISTAIPAILNYNYLPGDTLPSWWATDTEITATHTSTEYKTTAGWDYNNNGEPKKYATYGLRHKFTQIPFTYKAAGTSVSTKNTGIFRKVGNVTGTGTTLTSNSFIDSRYTEKIVDVHNLTKAELVKANNNSASGFKNLDGKAKGLFDMSVLDNYIGNWYHWLASPNASTRDYVCSVGNNYSDINSYHNNGFGVRPVVTLSSGVVFTDANEDGILEIN